MANNLCTPLHKYNRRHRSSATLSVASKDSKILDPRCDKPITPEILEEIFSRGSEPELFSIQEIKDLNLRYNHYAFWLKESRSSTKLPKSLKLGQSERDKAGKATVDRLIWLSKQQNIIYFEDYFRVYGYEFDQNKYRKQVEGKGCRLIGPYGLESGHTSRPTAAEDVLKAIDAILPSKSENNSY